MSFVKAVKSQAKLRMALAGPSGSGKTYSALAIGLALANGGRLALVDTEHGSAKKYASDFDFDVLEMEPPFHPDRFVEAISDAGKAGYTVIILDSLSHAWNGTGGLLEIVDQIAARMKTSNTFAAWKDATPIQNRLIDAIVRADIHVIATMRSKQEYVLEQVESGGRMTTRPRKVGMAPVQRDSFEYEFDIAGELDLEHNLIISKTRCLALDNVVVNKPGAQLAETITAWLNDGEIPTPVVVDDESVSFATIDDLLYQINQDFGLGEADAKAALKEAGYKSFKTSQSGEMYEAIKAAAHRLQVEAGQDEMPF